MITTVKRGNPEPWHITFDWSITGHTIRIMIKENPNDADNLALWDKGIVTHVSDTETFAEQTSSETLAIPAGTYVYAVKDYDGVGNVVYEMPTQKITFTDNLIKT